MEADILNHSILSPTVDGPVGTLRFGIGWKGCLEELKPQMTQITTDKNRSILTGLA
jgi:hypothetical protein